MLASSERGAVSIPSSSACSSKPDISITTGSRVKDLDSIHKPIGKNNHVRLASVDQTDSYSLSSVDVIDSNDLKYMDDSTSSSSTSSISSGGLAVNSSPNSAASLSPTAAQSSHSQDTLKLNARSPLACPLSNGPSNGPVSESPHGYSAAPLVNGQQSARARCSYPIHRSGQITKPSRIPVLTSLGRVRSPVHTRNGFDAHPDESLSPNNGHLSPSNSPTNSSPRTPVQQRNIATIRTTFPDSISIDGPTSLKRPHSPSECNSSNPSALPNGDVPRPFCDRPSAERSPPATLLHSVNRDDPGLNTKITNGFGGSEFEEDSRFRELLAMVSDSESDTESIAESIYHQPPKAADRSAASRLAKRLFHLDGFRITDVAKHLCKRNDFSQLVGEEFASLFDFANQRLDTALRAFLNTFSLTGESQERERILLHFSRRYFACNPGTYPNEEVCHTLVCALMLLNTDLHNPGVTRKMSCQDFINNLSQMHCGDCFSRDELKTLYNAIKQEPLRWPHADSAMMGFVNLYYPGPLQGPFGPSGPTPTGMLTPTGFYPHPAHSNTPMMFGTQPGHPNSFNPYAPMIHPSFQSPYTMTGPSSMVGGMSATGAGLPVPQVTALGTNLSGYTSPFYWNGSSISSSSQLNANVINPGSTSLTMGTNPTAVESTVTTKANLITGTNPYIDLTAETNAREYMRGLLVRKWVMESHGKKTSLGRRGWKVYYARLRDLVLYLYKNAMVANAAARAEELHNLHQQQLQQHQNYMRQLAIQQQQQQQQHLAMLQAQACDANSRLDHVNGDAKSDGEGELSTNSFGTTSAPATTANENSGAGSSSSPTSNGSQQSAVTAPEAANTEINFNSVSDYPNPDVASGSNSAQNTSSISDTQTEIPPLPSQSCTVQSYNLPSSVVTGDSGNSADLVHTSSIEATHGLSNSVMSMPAPLSFAAPLPQAPLSFPAPPSFIPPAIPPPEAVIRIAHAIASRAADYSKKPNVFRLKTRDGAEYLFEVSDAKELDMWVERINFVAALLSAPSMPGPISSERGFCRPHLPVTCTKLNMREQLEEHQRRLIELGRELADLHKRLPSFSGSKTLKPSRAASISGRASDTTTKAASKTTSTVAATVGEASNETKDNSTGPPESGSTESSTDRGDEITESLAPTTTTGASSSASPVATVASGSSSSAVSLISVFSTSSLGRRRKTSSGSLCGTSDTSLGPVLTAKQRAEHEERTQFTESEINRYKTYARLLEAELFRIQQSSAAVAHAAALAAANNFSPYMNPYGAVPGTVPGFQHYGPIGIGSGGSMPFPSPTAAAGPPPRYFVPRDPGAAYAAAPGMLPLAVFGSSDPLTEESSNSEGQSDSTGSNLPPVMTAESAESMENPPLPSVCPVPTATSTDPRHRSLPYSYYGPHLAPPTPYSPSVSGRFYSNPRQLRNPQHYRQQQQQHGFGGFGRTNGLMMLNGHHRLAEEEPTSSAESPPSPSADSSSTATSESGDQLTSCSLGSTDKFKLTLQSSSQPLCSTEGMFYEIV